ncbi:MAG: glycosyltransferase family 4 protein [Anaerolineales bacterium]|nr:glycosyltransferase family 4 protein [Anaerolineales bacterium]MCA9977855.1 glycosyltransferase family 4 protein [Anaerolineales bacterium]
MTTTFNVLYIHPSNELYGSDRSLLRLVQALSQTSIEPFVIVPDDLEYEGLLTNELQKMHVPFQELGLGVLRRRYRNVSGGLLFIYRTVKAAVQIAHYCRQHKFHLIHSNSTAVFTGALAAKLARIPHIWHVREIIEQPRWLNKVTANVLWWGADVVIAVSQPVKENLLISQPKLASKIRVIHNGINPKAYKEIDTQDIIQLRHSWGIPITATVIGMVGRISSWKGQNFLLQAAADILKQDPNVYLVFVGGTVPGETWRRQELEDAIYKLGIQDQVILDDFRIDIPVVLASFDIFVLPSTRPDPFPGVVLEAMFAGKPVVATAHGGALEQVQKNVTGLLVSPTETNEMTEALHKLIYNPQLRIDMGNNGRQRALTLFTTELYVTNVINVYNQIREGEF